MKDHLKISGMLVAALLPVTVSTLSLWIVLLPEARAWGLILYAGATVSACFFNLALYFWALGAGEE